MGNGEFVSKVRKALSALWLDGPKEGEPVLGKLGSGVLTVATRAACWCFVVRG